MTGVFQPIDYWYKVENYRVFPRLYGITAICSSGIGRSLKKGPYLPPKPSFLTFPQVGTSVIDELSSRHPKARVAFAHRDPAQVARCVQELKRVGYVLEARVLPDPELLPFHPELATLDLAICEF